MQSYELQVYKNGKWEFDSYFDDRSTALFEAERLHQNDRYNGIRVLEERYRENSETSDCTVIFSRLRKADKATSEPRMRVSRETYRMAVREATKSSRQGNAPSRRARKTGKAQNRTRNKAKTRGRPAPRSHASIYTLAGVALVIVLVGIGAMIGLRYMAETM